MGWIIGGEYKHDTRHDDTCNFIGIWAEGVKNKGQEQKVIIQWAKDQDDFDEIRTIPLFLKRNGDVYIFVDTGENERGKRYKKVIKLIYEEV